MGAKQSKIEGCYLPATPTVETIYTQRVNMNINNIENEMMDPRSPSGSRTPIHNPNNGVDTKIQLVSVETPKRDSHPDNNPLEVLRKRFFRGFSYNLNDPRSPSLHLNRTPLIFDDTLEQSLSLDDTFADLFVDSRQREKVDEIKQQEELKPEENQDIEMTDLKEKLRISVKEEENAVPQLPKTPIILQQDLDPRSPSVGEKFDLSVKEEENAVPQLPKTPIILQQDLDPRSPSVGVERTPIIFTDDENDEASEDFMLENILATLSLNLNSSGIGSVASMASQNSNASFHDNNSEIIMSKPMNKHLDRVKGAKKSSSKGTHHKPKRRLSRQQIYEDRENQSATTPQLKMSQIENNDILKGRRTPLGCVRNRNSMHTRSRSVESSVKSIKTRLALTSFDDTVNPSGNKKLHNSIIIQQDSKDSAEP